MIIDMNAQNRTRRAAIVRSVVTNFPYWCMAAMRALTPYLFALVLLLLQSPTAHAADPAEIFVQQNIARGYAILNDAALAPGERERQFRALLLSIVDVKRVALFTLGPYARGASNSQIESFVPAFTDFVTAIFRHNLDSDAGGAIAVTGSTPRAPDDIIVSAKLLGANGTHSNAAPVNIAFRVRKNADGGDAIVDLQVEGVSMALMQREDFTGYLQQHGGNIGLLAAELEDRAKHVNSSSSMAQTENAR